MSIQANPEAIPFGITAMIAAVLAVLAWRRVGRGGGALAASFAVMMVGEAAWALFDAIELVVGDLAVKQACLALRTAGSSATVLGLLAVVLVDTGRARWLTRHLAELVAPMVVLTLLAWANPLHHAFWSSIENRRIGGYLVAVVRYGPAFWAYVAYGYGLTAFATALLSWVFWRSRGVFRAQAGFMLFGVLLPWVVNVVDPPRAAGPTHLDPAALAFGVAGLAFLPVIFRFGLLALTPVAWEAVMRRMEDAVFVIDPRRRIVGVNPAGERLLDREAEAILGTDAARALARWPVLAARLGEIGQRGEMGFELIEPGSDPGGTTATVYDVRISRLGVGPREAGTGDGVESAGWVLVLRDVSASRRAEAERVQVLREQAARAEAETANRSKDRFLATLSHELRTPLSPILATVTAILERPDTPEPLRAAMEMIRRNVNLEVRLIDDLLDLARVRGGKLHLKRETVDAHELIHRVAEICRDDLRGAGLRLAVDLSAVHHDVDADPIRLQQVLWNLLKNAIKFTPAGGTIMIRTHDGPAPAQPPADSGGLPDDGRASAGGMLVISVADTGIGIAAEVLPRIFDLFEQGSAESARRSGGLGLGLTISRSIIERHGGRLRAASAGTDRGSTFTVELPTVPAAAEIPTIEPFEPDVRSAAAGRRPLRILLVDDNDDTRNSLAELLTRRGHEVRGASGVDAALRAADSADFDLLISDIELIDGTGLQLVQALRTTRPVPAIALSGMGSSDDMELSRAAGFDLHLMKPIDMPELEEAIERVGGRSHDVLASRTVIP
ncbi:MAG: hybrid sensor histidine kinase/response regulator [Isosphaeraceae bacterium]